MDLYSREVEDAVEASGEDVLQLLRIEKVAADEAGSFGDGRLVACFDELVRDHAADVARPACDQETPANMPAPFGAI